MPCQGDSDETVALLTSLAFSCYVFDWMFSHFFSLSFLSLFPDCLLLFLSSGPDSSRRVGAGLSIRQCWAEGKIQDAGGYGACDSARWGLWTFWCFVLGGLNSFLAVFLNDDEKQSCWRINVRLLKRRG